ncbi:putative nuclear pore protein [Rosellinia necatrix]|uniref:Putative nuclear pore protein n=1 Tax=Rosellinia necatrix TaxID=77044 RepID=A0A1W2TU94_ROSNE|nr:putative nuclear pore protein [Rosellinia necatrix]
MASFFDSLLDFNNQRRLSGGSECSHAKFSPPVEEIDPDGDMMLSVGRPGCTYTSCNYDEGRRPNAICFHVDSTVVAGASSTLGLVVYSPSAKAATDSKVKWTVKLPDDDPQAMRTVIDILYGRCPIPSLDNQMSIEQLLRLTILADRYDLVHLFTKWIGQWVEDMAPYWVNKKFVRQSTETLESLLWISWVIGHEPLYAHMILQIAFHSELDDTGELTDPAEQLCFVNESYKVSVPPCAPIEIGHSRIEVLKLIRKDIKETVERHLHGNQNRGRPCCGRTDGDDDLIWRRGMLETFLKMLDREGIWPLPPAHMVTASPRSLVEIFRVNPEIPSFIHQGRFCEADGSFWHRIDKLLGDIYFILPQASAKHLRAQAEKSGLADYFKSKGPRFAPDRGIWKVKEILEFQKAITESESVPAQERRR